MWQLKRIYVYYFVVTATLVLDDQQILNLRTYKILSLAILWYLYIQSLGDHNTAVNQVSYYVKHCNHHV